MRALNAPSDRELPETTPVSKTINSIEIINEQ